MRDELLNFLARREETITVGGVPLIVREIGESTDTTQFRDGVDSLYKFIVLCVFTADGEPAFSDADIPRLKNAGKVRLREIAAAVGRVNGWDEAAELKN